MDEELEVLKEAERRGMIDYLTPEQKAIYERAKKDGYIQSAQPEPVSDAETKFNEQGLVDKAIGLQDYATSQVRGVVGDTARSVAQVFQGVADATGLYDAMGIDGQQVQKSADTLRDLIAGEPYSESGKLLKEAFNNKLSRTIQGTSAEDALLMMDEQLGEIKSFLNDKTGSEVVTEGILAAPEVAFDILIPLLAPVRGTKASGKALMKDIRETMVNLDVDASKVREIRNAAYDSVKTKSVKKGTFDNLLNRINDDLISENISPKSEGVGSILEGIKRDFQTDFNVRQSRVSGGRANEFVNDIITAQKNLYKGYNSATDTVKRAINVAAQSVDGFILDSLDGSLTKRSLKSISGEKVKKQLDTGKRIGGQLIRSKQIDEVFRQASYERDPLTAIENGLKNIVKDPKKERFYSDHEKSLFKEITTGNPLSGEQAEKGLLMRMVGTIPQAMGSGLLVKMARAYRAKRAFQGEPIQGAVMAPAKGIENFLYRSNAITEASESLAKQVLLGKDGIDAVKRYLKAVPKKSRNYEELGEILAMSDYDLRDLKMDETVSRLQREAVQYAKGVKIMRSALASGTTSSLQGLNQEEEENAPIY